MKKVFLALVCMVTLFAVTSCGGTTPADAAKDCIEMVKAGDYEGFVETIKFSDEMTAEEVEQTKAMYVSLLSDKGAKQIEKKGGMESYTLVSEEISEDGQTAKVVYEVVYADGSKDEQKFDMILVDGKWMQQVNK